MLERDLTIRWLSGQTETLLGICSNDINRPIGSIRHTLRWNKRGGEQQEKSEHREDEGRATQIEDVPLDMESVAAEVIATVRACESEVRGPKDQWYLMRVRPYLTLDNKVDGAVMVFMDITELKRNERTVIHAREYAEAIIETGHEPMLVLDGALCVERANRAFYRAFEISPVETIGQTVFDLGDHQLDSLDLRSLLQDVLPLRTTIEEFQVTYPSTRRGLRTMVLNARRLEIYGKSPRILLAIQDVTERLRAEKNLLMLTKKLTLTEQRERKSLATELHDSLVQLLALSKIKVDQIKQQTGGSLVEELDGILDQALTYTRTLVAQLSPPFFRDLGLPYAFKWLAEQMEPCGLRLTVEVENGFPSVADDDATLLFQATRELLMNVVKHAGTDHARLAVITADGAVHITVSDEGSGFDVAAAMSLAGVDAQTSRAPGFGLFSIHERMRAIGGRLELVSRPGDGTRATLVLPIGDQAEPVPLSSGAPRATPDDSQTIRVLLVDDHAMVRQGLRTILDSYPDIEVVGEAADGEEAVAAADRLRPSVVVMDINMPRMSGIEATAHIKAHDPAVVVIGLSVQADAHSRLALLGAGAVALVTKEAAAEELYRTIRRFLESPPS